MPVIVVGCRPAGGSERRFAPGPTLYSPPWCSPLSELGRLTYLGSTLIVSWVLGIVLASPLCSAYADQAGRPGHISALTDQQLAAV